MNRYFQDQDNAGQHEIQFILFLKGNSKLCCQITSDLSLSI